MQSDPEQLSLRDPNLNSKGVQKAPWLPYSCAGLVWGLISGVALTPTEVRRLTEQRSKPDPLLCLHLAMVQRRGVQGPTPLLTFTATAIGAEPVPGMAGTLVASRVVVAVLVTAVRTTVTLIDI